MSVALLNGMLYGITIEAECQLMAWRPNDGAACYSQMRVVDAPLDCPDGAYTVVVEGKVYSTEKRQGWWQMVELQRECA